MTDLTSLGIRAVRASSSSCVIAMPKFYVDVDLEDIGFASVERRPLDLLSRMEAARGLLFHDVIGHIAKHDRHPLDRMRQVEAAAYATLPDSEWHDSPSQAQLRALLTSKSGSPSWRRDGYGKEAEVAP